MANEYLTVKQAQYQYEKLKQESGGDYVAKSGDTMTGKLILSGGLAITSAPRDTAPSFLLTLHEPFADGGTVGWVAKADVPSSIGMGTVSTHNGSSTNVSTATDTTLCNSGSLSAGTYILKAVVQFAASSSGRRVIFLTTSSTGANIDRYTITQSAAAPSGATYVELVHLITITSATTYYLRAYQNSGSTLSCSGGIEYVKLH